MVAYAMTEMNHKTAIVIGLGKTGLSAVPHLIANNYHVEVMDSRKQPPQATTLRNAFPQIPVHTGAFDRKLLASADLLVISPGVAVTEPAIAEARESGIEIIGDIELFARTARAPVIAVTGANGKSTVSVLVAEMCSEAGLDTRLGGNIGVPALELLKDDEPDVYVLELSSFQLETTFSLDARAAVVLNISEDHMDRYRDINEYAETKARIFNGTGVVVLNADDPLVSNMKIADRETIYFGFGAPKSERDYGINKIDGKTWLVHGKKKLLAADEIKVPGKHNVANVLASLALASVLDVPVDAAIRAVKGYRGLPHRCQLIAESNGVKWINDSKATNVGATTAALQGMESPVIWVAGGEGKDADFAPLKEAASNRVRDAILFGRDASLIESAIEGTIPVHQVEDLAQAVRLAHELAHQGDVVMLSPACASFDMFDNFMQRGDVFAQLVREQIKQ